MERFMFLIREDLKKMQTMTPAERQAVMPAMLKWVESIAEVGDYQGGQPLTPTGRYVRKDEVLSDGPFIEAKEGVSGYTLMKAQNLEQAVAIAQMCPLITMGIGAIEVRPILTVPPELRVPGHDD